MNSHQQNDISSILDTYFDMDPTSSTALRWIGRLRSMYQKKKIIMNMEIADLYTRIVQQYSHPEHLKLLNLFLEWHLSPPVSLLKQAVEKGEDSLVRFLLDRGMRFSPLYSILSGKDIMQISLPILSMLLPHQIYSVNERGDTLLHSLVRNPHLSKNKLIILLMLIIDAGVNPSHVNNAGLTAADLLIINHCQRPLADIRILADAMKKKHAFILLDPFLSQQYHDLNKSPISK